MKQFTIVLPLDDRELLKEVKQEIESVLEPDNTSLYIRPEIKEVYSGKHRFHVVSCCKISVMLDDLSYAILRSKKPDWIKRAFNANNEKDVKSAKHPIED